MKSKKLLISFLTVTLTLTGCKNNKVEDEPTGEKTYAQTDTYLAIGNYSEYKIVRPVESTSYEQFATNELQELFFKATSYTLPIITDENLNLDLNAKLISVGETNLFKQSGIEVSVDELGLDGSRVVTKDNMLFLAGATDKGTINAVYDFLHYTFNYECYAPDEIYIDKVDTIKLYKFDEKNIPSFNERSTSYQVQQNSTFALRVRAQAKTYNWAKWTHSEFFWMDPTVYAASHPNWYNDDQNQLCLTRDVGDLSSDNYDHSNMRGTYVEGVKKYLINNKTATHMMLGIVDNRKKCECDSCKESDERYGTHSGTRVRFYNAVVRELNAWLAKEFPGRKVMFSCFAYLSCFDAPVNYDAATNTYTATDPSVIPCDNLSILWAPMDACFAHPFTDPCNKVSYDSLKGWASIAKHIYVWNYCTDFTMTFLPFNNFNSLAENYKLFKKYNVEFLYDQGNEFMSPFFNAMMTYVQTKLMWNVDYDVNKLIEDFMNHYYKDAAPYVLQYYNLVKSRYALLEKQSNDLGKHFEITVYGVRYAADELPGYFPYSVLIQFKDLMDKALDAANMIEDEATRELVVKRVHTESLVYKYFILKYYNSYYSKASLEEMINEFEALTTEAGISYDNPNGGKYIPTFIAELRSLL